MNVHPMPHIISRPGQGLLARHEFTRGTKRRSNWFFQPQQVVCLEERALLSTFATTSVEAAASSERLDSGSDYSDSAPPMNEIHNVPFPTVDGQSELLDVYTPRTPAPAGGRPVIIAIHGGGWRRLDKAGYGSRVAAAFVRDGYDVVAPNYVLSAPGKPTWPVNFEDVQAAVRWVRSNAGALGINPNEIVAMGESAGANLAALLGVYSTQNGGDGVSSAVDAVVASSTPTDLTILANESPLAGLAAAQFLGGSPEEVPANYIAASPIDHVSSGDPPMLLIHGRQDPLIPVSQSEQMQAALTAAGVRNELILVNGGHDLDFPPHYSNLIPDVLEFLDTTWKTS
jgi:acetyl esterase/lipase